MSDNSFAEWMLESAEQADRKLDPARIRQLERSYRLFKECGLSDDDIKNVMALTAHEMRLIRQSLPKI